MWTVKIIAYGEVFEHEIDAGDLGAAVEQALDNEGLLDNDEGSYTIEVSGG